MAKCYIAEFLKQEDVDYINNYEVQTKIDADLDKIVKLISDRDDNIKNSLLAVRDSGFRGRSTRGGTYRVGAGGRGAINGAGQGASGQGRGAGQRAAGHGFRERGAGSTRTQACLKCGSTVIHSKSAEIKEISWG